MQEEFGQGVMQIISPPSIFFHPLSLSPPPCSLAPFIPPCPSISMSASFRIIVQFRIEHATDAPPPQRFEGPRKIMLAYMPVFCCTAPHCISLFLSLSPSLSDSLSPPPASISTLPFLSLYTLFFSIIHLTLTIKRHNVQKNKIEQL